MRLKIKLDLDKISIEDIAIKTASILNRLLGNNHKWHSLEKKPYTCSFIMGGKFENGIYKFSKNDYAYFFINTEDDEVLEAILKTSDINFDIQNIEVFKTYNLLSVKNIIYNVSSKTKWITEKDKQIFIEKVRQKYCVDIEIYKITNHSIIYKKGKRLPVTDLLIKCYGDKNVMNLFESGIGGSCSIGFGFVSPIK